MPPTDLASFPPDLIQAVICGAEVDAILVHGYLNALGVTPDETAKTPLPMRWALDLGAALRINSWERNGLWGSDLGLPTGREALRTVIDSLTDPNHRWGELGLRVMIVEIERFSWASPASRDIDVRVVGIDEEVSLDAIADMLWSFHLRSN